MWERYKKTFVGMQTMILVITVFAFFGLGRVPAVAGLFFVTMQTGALIGAAWAARLKRKCSPQPLCNL